MNFVQRHAYDAGFRVAALFWPFFTRRRRISIENILRCGVTDDPKAAARLARQAFCHFLGHIFETVFVSGVITAENWREHLDLSEISPHAAEMLFSRLDTPILIVSGHHGCWEVATNIVPFARPMIAIARVVDNKFLARWMQKHHFRGPVTLVNKNDGFREHVLRQWFETKAALTLLMDQFTYRGARLRFMGRPSRTVTTAARLGIRYGYPIVIGSFVRIAPYKYRLVADDPIVFAHDSDRDAATQLLNNRLEKAIRAYPEQYLWMHRRWRDD